MTQEFKKGQLLKVKAPPYYEKEYFYEITAAGDKQIKASLYHSPKVRKSWTRKELEILIEMGMVRLAKEDEKPLSVVDQTVCDDEESD